MAVWTMSDGTVVRSGGEVTGTGAVAQRLRGELAAVAAGDHVYVMVAPPPGGDVPLVLTNDWLVDRWTRGHAARAGLGVETDYVPSDDDRPADVQELLAERAAGPSYSADTVF